MSVASQDRIRLQFYIKLEVRDTREAAFEYGVYIQTLHWGHSNPLRHARTCAVLRVSHGYSIPVIMVFEICCPV